MANRKPCIRCGGPKEPRRKHLCAACALAPCAIEGCEAQQYESGWCTRHYLRWKRHGDPLSGGPLRSKQPPTCVIDGCAKPAVALGLCGTHYERQRKHGDPNVVLSSWVGRKRLPLEERFWAKVDRSGDGCWPWLGTKHAKGYGHFKMGDRIEKAHRVAYKLAVGPIPEGLTIDHVKERGCTSTSCCRPDHLEPVTSGENTLRGGNPPAQNARKTHCKRGHAFDDENTVIVKGGRQCRSCKNERGRQTRRRRKARLNAAVDSASSRHLHN